jgi:hypothetical protein
MAVSQIYAVSMEKVRSKLPYLQSLSHSAFLTELKKTPTEKVSPWYAGSGAVLGYRIPVEQFVGGAFGGISLDNAAFLQGNQMTTQYMTIGYTAVSLSFLLPTISMDGTASSEQAVVNVFKKTMKDAIKTFTAYEDSLAFASGNAVLATGIGSGATPAGTNPLYVCEPNFGPQRLELGQIVDVYNAAGSSLKGTSLQVTAIDPVAKTAQLTGTVTSPLNSDVIAVANYAATLAAGTTRYGLYNYNSSTTSGSTLGLSRTTVPELVTPNYTASASLTSAMGLILNDYRIQRRDATVIGKTMGICHMAQRQAIFNTGDAVVQWTVNGPDIARNLDRTPGNRKENDKVPFCGVEYMVSKKADRSRLDQVVMDDWGRVNLKDLDYFSKPDGGYIFEGRDTNGNVMTSMNFFLVSSENTYCSDPGGGGIISALTIPTGM